jgi:hypothetical protein
VQVAISQRTAVAIICIAALSAGCDNLLPTPHCSMVGSDRTRPVSVAVKMDQAHVPEPTEGFIVSWLEEHGWHQLGSSPPGCVLAVTTDEAVLQDPAVEALPGFQKACVDVLRLSP